jgi:hypothetical protein
MNFSKVESCRSFNFYFSIIIFFKDMGESIFLLLNIKFSCCCIRNLILFGH